MRKRGAAFADNAQAALALPDKHTRKQKECGGGTPRPAPGSPAPPPRCRELARSHPPPTLEILRPLCPWAQLRSVGASLPLWHPQSTGGGKRPLRTCLRHGLCPHVPIPGWCDHMAWQVWAALARGLQPSPCSSAALPVPPRPGRGGQGPVPRVLTQQDEQLWWDHPGAKEQHQGTLGQQHQAARGGQAKLLGSPPHPLLPPTAPCTPGQLPELTGGRLNLPAAWRLPRSSPAVSGSHRGTASLSSVGGGHRRGQQRWIRPSLLPQPHWATQTCTLPHGAGGAFAAPRAGKPHPPHGPSAARFLGDQSPMGRGSLGATPCLPLTLSIMPFSMMGTPDL